VTHVVEVRDVVMKFGDTTALDGVTLDVNDGELFGLVGPDGAGKTTLFRILTSLILPTSGTATVLGFDVKKDLWEIRSRVGYMPGGFSLYPDLSVIENLEFFAAVFGTTVEEGYELIAPIYKQIEPFRDRRADALSGGMKQKLALSCALVHRPQLLFLDEPTTGVDAVSRREFWDQLEKLRATGLAIVASTPYMDEAMRCDRIALLHGGHVLGIDTPTDIGHRFEHPLVSVKGTSRYQMLRKLREYPQVHSVYLFGDALHFADKRAELAAADVAREVEAWLRANGQADAKAEPIEAGIEDSFMSLMSSTASAA
jgi:ABC-type multidrug transport system ATPase subunit